MYNNMCYNGRKAGRQCIHKERKEGFLKKQQDVGSKEEANLPQVHLSWGGPRPAAGHVL